MAITGSLRINEQPVQLVQGPNVDDDTTWIIDLQAPQVVEYRSTELDQTDPAGRYRLRGDGDEWLVQRAATAAWATATTLVAFNSTGQYIPDDILLRLGTSGDIAMVLRAATLAADTALTNVLVGTPVTPALAADSLIISNVTGSGDILIAARDGGSANSSAYLFIDASAGVMYLTPAAGGLTIGLAADAPSPDLSMVHIWAATAGAITAISGTLLTVENSGVTYISILTPNTAQGGLLVGDPERNDAGWLIYDHANTRWEVGVENTVRLHYSAGAFAFQEATTISTSAGNLTLNAFNTLVVNSADFSGTPALTGSLAAIQNQTFTDNVTAASGTVAAHAFAGIAIPTFDSLNGGAGTEVTVTDAATWYIAGPPAAVTNKTIITNPWSLWVDAGNCRFDGNIYFATSGASIQALNTDASTLLIQARDTGVGEVEIGRFVGAADPYLQIGRDDTGVATNAITDMLVLQAGAGTNNEAQDFGLGISLRIGNAASEVEERGSIDLVLVIATDGAEDSRFDVNVMGGGAMSTILKIDKNGLDWGTTRIKDGTNLQIRNSADSAATGVDMARLLIGGTGCIDSTGKVNSPSLDSVDVLGATVFGGRLITVKVTVAYTGTLFDAVGLTDSANIWQQPANSILVNAKLVLDTQFAATSMTDLDVTIGDGGGNTGILNATMNLTSDATTTQYKTKGSYFDATAGTLLKESATQWIAYATAIGANLSTLTVGQISVYFTYIQL